MVDERPDAVVVGAGIAGLTAARDLAAAGLSVARPRGLGRRRRQAAAGPRSAGSRSTSAPSRCWRAGPRRSALAAELGLDGRAPGVGLVPDAGPAARCGRCPRTLLGVALDLDELAASGVLSDDGPRAGARTRRRCPLGDDGRLGRPSCSARGSGTRSSTGWPSRCWAGVYAGHARDAVRAGGRAPGRRAAARARLAAGGRGGAAAARRRRRPGVRRAGRRAGPAADALAADGRLRRSARRRPSASCGARRPASG